MVEKMREKRQNSHILDNLNLAEFCYFREFALHIGTIIAWEVRNVKKGLAIRGNFYYDER